MNILSLTHTDNTALPILLLLGAFLLLLGALFGSTLYIWGHKTQNKGNNWNDMVANIFIFWGAFPVFMIGLVLLLIGLILRIKG